MTRSLLIRIGNSNAGGTDDVYVHNKCTLSANSAAILSDIFQSHINDDDVQDSFKY